MGPVVPAKLSQAGPRLPDVGRIVDVTDAEWGRVADLFDPDGRRGAPDLVAGRSSRIGEV
jgi:hypothetical protein